MSGAGKQRAAAPPPPLPAAADNAHSKERAHNGKANYSSSLTYSADVTDDISMNEAGEQVTLDVTLPSGLRTDITVDYNTPILDLLVSLAAKSKLNPTGLALILVSEDTGKALSYKPNQIIGALGGRVVRIVNKDVVSARSTGRDSKLERPFEVTHRFTVNFPRGQKTVVRVSPLMTLAELLNTVCRDKGLDLDLSRYVLQIPGNPGVPVNLGASIQQVGVYEMNLVTVAVAPSRNHTASTPDLSRPTLPSSQSLPVTSVAGDHKKKKGLLSYLGKKDKKHKLSVQHIMVPVSSTSVHSSASHLQTTSPVPQKQENQTENQLKRPQSVFVLPITSRENNNFQQQDPQLTMIPAIKKRRAPAPPAPPNSQTVVSAPTPPTVVSAPTPPRNPQTVGSLPTSPLSVNTHSNDHVKTSSAENVQNEICENTQTVHNKKTALTRQTASDLEEVSASAGAPQQQVTRLDMLSYIHSRNSSDSSGYHELTLSGCESPEATHVSHTNYKTSIDTTSVDSSDNANGDSAILESPVRVSPIVELPEKSDTDLMSGLTIISIDSLPPRKTRKAPAPPRVQSSPAQVPAESLAPIVREAWGSATASELPIESVADTGGENKLETRSPRDGDQVGEIAALGSSDVLDRAVSNSQLQSMEFVFITKSEHEDGDSTMMMETASVCSENIEQVDISSHGNHACSLILPPPPLDPSSGDETVESPYSQADNVSVDKDKDIAEGIRSVAPSSAVHSQGHARKNSHVSLGSVDTVEGISLDFQQTIQLGEEAFSLPSEDMEASFGYKSEMALFVERMRTLAVEKAEEEKHEPLDDSGSSLSVPCSDSNYDSESVIQHHHMDSSSETGSLTRREGGWLQLLHLQSNLDGCHEDVSEQVAEQPIMCEESVEHAATLRPPPEFVDRDDNSTDDRTFRPTDEKTDSSIDKRTCKKDNENTFTEIVQENCNLVDFTSTEHVAATTIKVKQTSANNDMFMDNKVKNSGTSVNSDTLTDNKVKDTMTLSNNDMENKVNASGTLLVNSHTFTDHTLMNRETLVNVDTFTDCTGPPTSMFGHGNNSQPKLVELQAQTTPVRKEEIILTTEDLSNVTFLPPKSKRAKPIHIQPYVQTQPYIRPLSASLIMAKSGRLTAGNDIKSNMSATEDVQSRVSSRLLLSQGPDTTVNEQSQTAHDLPLTQPFMHASEIHTDSNDDVSDDPLISKSRPRLLMNSSNNPSRKSTLGQLQVDGNNKKVANRHSSSYQISKTSSIVTNEIDQQIGKSIVAPRQNTQKISSTDVAASTTAAGGERVNDQISRSSDDKISEELRRKRRHLNSTRSGSASVSTNESLSSAPPARDQMSRESAEGKQTAPLATDQMSRESAVGKQTAPPATDQRSRESAVGKQTAPLATDQMSRESAVGKQTAPPATDQIRRESAVGKQTAPPATDQIRRESAVGKQTAPPATDQRSRESAVGKQTAPPATDQRSRESAVGKQTAPPATDQRSRESAVGKQTAPPAKDQMSRESAVGKQTAPLATDQIRRESAVGKQTAPPATDQIRRESAVGKQRSKSTPQPQLDLHEQLMAAVRMFSRDAMKSVCKTMVKAQGYQLQKLKDTLHYMKTGKEHGPDNIMLN